MNAQEVRGIERGFNARYRLLLQMFLSLVRQGDVIVLSLDIIELRDGMICTRVPSRTTIRWAYSPGSLVAALSSETGGNFPPRRCLPRARACSKRSAPNGFSR